MIPASLRGLGLDNVLDSVLDDIRELLALFGVAFRSQDSRQKERGQAVTFHVVGGLGRVFGEYESVASGLSFGHQPVRSLANVGRIGLRLGQGTPGRSL